MFRSDNAALSYKALLLASKSGFRTDNAALSNKALLCLLASQGSGQTMQHCRTRLCSVCQQVRVPVRQCGIVVEGSVLLASKSGFRSDNAAWSYKAVRCLPASQGSGQTMRHCRRRLCSACQQVRVPVRQCGIVVQGSAVLASN